MQSDTNGLIVHKFCIPKMKCNGPGQGQGKTTQCARQNDETDPFSALDNHFHVNPGEESKHLFSWTHTKYGKRPLTRVDFIKCFKEVAIGLGKTALKGHSIRMGGTLLYLLQNVPFNAVKVQGRWSGKAFQLYLRKHAVILAPYLQATPIFDLFNCIMMPPVW